MKQSLRAKRMARNHKRLSQNTKLNLVSLMDIFTILVFFLMVNTSEVQVMQNNKSITLATSESKQVAEENVLITVTTEHILVQGQQIITIAALTEYDGELVTELVTELEYQQSKIPDLNEQMLSDGLAINIMADKSVPYATLKKVLKTSASTGYNNISLAVSQILASSTVDRTANLMAENKE